jgi:hypothetical protein
MRGEGCIGGERREEEKRMSSKHKTVDEWIDPSFQSWILLNEYIPPCRFIIMRMGTIVKRRRGWERNHGPFLFIYVLRFHLLVRCPSYSCHE